MKLVLLFMSLFLFACGNSVGTIEDKWVGEAEKTIDAIIPDGNYRDRYKAVGALSGSQLCEAVLPLQRLDGIFIPMLEPVGVIRWKYEPQIYLPDDQTSNINIAVGRLYNQLTAETEFCSKANGRNFYEQKPWEDWACGVVAVRKVCGDEFVSEANYDRLLAIFEERKVYRSAVTSREARAAYRAANPTTYCSGTTVGGVSRLYCN